MVVPESPRSNIALLTAQAVLRENMITFPPVMAEEVLSRYARIVYFDDPFEEGFIFRKNLKYYVYINKRSTTSRSNWTYAHEMGHLLMHHLRHADKQLTPENVFSMRREANEFAANLLMPEDWIRQCVGDKLPSFDDLRLIVRLFRVSWDALGYRLDELGICENEYFMWLAKKSV